MKYVFVIVAPVFIYALFVSAKILYAAKFSGIVEIVQEDKVFGEGEELRLIAAGDSVTLGTGASSVTSTYAYKVGEFFGKEHKVTYRNIATSGAKTKDFIEKQLPEIITFEPDIVLITIGGNDVLRNKSKEKIIENYKKIIEELVNNTSATIYIASMPNFREVKPIPAWYVRIIHKKTLEINTELDGLGSARVKIIDSHSKWANITDIESTFAGDGFHASDHGYTFWTEAFLKRIKI